VGGGGVGVPFFREAREVEVQAAKTKQRTRDERPETTSWRRPNGDERRAERRTGFIGPSLYALRWRTRVAPLPGGEVPADAHGSKGSSFRNFWWIGWSRSR